MPLSSDLQLLVEDGVLKALRHPIPEVRLHALEQVGYFNLLGVPYEWAAYFRIRARVMAEEDTSRRVRDMAARLLKRHEESNTVDGMATPQARP